MTIMQYLVIVLGRCHIAKLMVGHFICSHIMCCGLIGYNHILSDDFIIIII